MNLFFPFTSSSPTSSTPSLSQLFSFFWSPLPSQSSFPVSSISVPVVSFRQPSVVPPAGSAEPAGQTASVQQARQTAPVQAAPVQVAPVQAFLSQPIPISSFTVDLPFSTHPSPSNIHPMITRSKASFAHISTVSPLIEPTSFSEAA